MRLEFVESYLQEILKREPTREEITIAETVFIKHELKAYTSFYRELNEALGINLD